jgi:outer membrane protein TolC
MKRLALICVIPTLIYANSLKDLLDHAGSSNHMIASKILTEQSKMKDLDSAKNSYYPTIDIGGTYQNLNQKSTNTAGDIYSGYVSVGVDLYDGGYKSNVIDKNKALLESSKLQTSAYKKSLELSIVEDFYNIKNVESTIKALKEKGIQLEAELQRITQFYEVGSATKDEIDKLQAELSNNTYAIETSKYQLSSLKQILAIRVGQDIKELDDSTLQVPVFEEGELSDAIKAMVASADSYTYSAKSIESSYNPQITLKNTYTIYDYGRTDSTHPSNIPNQNKLLLSFSMKLYDNGVIKNKRDSLLLQKKALQEEIEQSIKNQNVNVKLAVLKIDTTRAQIRSAKKSLESAKSVYEKILEKYKVGVVDNVAYLDALSTKTNAQAQYDKALNDLQVAYATYYYYTNKNIKEYVK